MSERGFKMLRLPFVLAIGLFCVISIFPQTDSAGTAGPRPKVKTPAKPSKPAKPATPKHTPTGKTSGGKSNPAKPKTADVTIEVSEPEAEIFLTDQAGESVFDTGSQLTGDDKAPVTIEDLKAGKYDLLVRKPGFYDETSVVTIVGGKPNKVVINMRASVAFLTITGNVTDANIDVEGLGTFLGELRRQQVKPGTYRIKVSKKGYIADSQVAEINSPGEDRMVTFNLRPLPIAAMLADADNKLKAGEFDAAISITKQIIETDPIHPRANLILGNALLQKGSADGTPYFLTAIRNGETATFPAHVLYKDGQLIGGDLILDSTSLRFVTRDRPELSFSSLKFEISTIEKGGGGVKVNYVRLSGSGIMGKKPAKREFAVSIYSPIAFLRGKNDVYCLESAGGAARCNPEMSSLFDLLSNWQRTTN